MGNIALTLVQQEAAIKGIKNYHIEAKSFVSTNDKRTIDIAKGNFIVVYKVHFVNSAALSLVQFKSPVKTQDVFCPSINSQVDAYGVHDTNIDIEGGDVSTFVIHYLLISTIA